MAVEASSRSCTIVLHDERVSHLNVLGGTDVLPVGTIAYLSSSEVQDFLVIGEGRAAGQKEVSLHVRLGAQFGFDNRTPGKLTIVKDEDKVTATHIDLFFRDQYLSRTDMWLMTKQLESRVIYRESPVHYLGREAATVQDIHINGRGTACALVQQGKTKSIIRSGSSRFTILIQLSRELFEYNEAGYLQYEEVVEGYLTELFRRWEHTKAKHVVSIVLFGRRAGQLGEDTLPDFFQVLALDVPSSQWRDLKTTLKRAFNSPCLSLNNSSAVSGNLLEALHLSALDFLEGGESLHFNSTGSSLIAITAGTGAFEADYILLKKTTDILLGHSIGVDIVSLAHKPQHPVPLFKYRLDDHDEYALPHWTDISYWSRDVDDADSTRLPWKTTSTVVDVDIPLLDANFDLTQESFDRYDRDVFSTAQDFASTKPPSSLSSYPSTSLESNRTVKATSPPRAVRKSAAMLPSLKHRPSASSIATTISLNRQSQSTASAILSNRKISVGPRGLAPMKSTAVASISETHANNANNHSPSISKFIPHDSKGGLANQIRATLQRRPSSASVLSRITDPEERTQPIDIQAADSKTDSGDSHAESSVEQEVSFTKIARTNSKTPKAFDGMTHSPQLPSIDPGAEARTPWLTLLDPCNMRKDNMRVASQYRQWQHVFPKAIDSGDFKWTSMCSPAALPLYNDLYPSSEDLQRYYKRSTRRMVCSQPNAGGRRPQELMRQLVTVRLAHGFQIVARSESVEHAHIFMSIGADYHELQCLSDLELEIVEYTHNSTGSTNTSYVNEASVKRFDVTSIHGTELVQAHANFAEQELLLNWAAIDQAIDSQDASESMFEMRFVLLPVEPRPQQGDWDLADDEKRIEGIQRLTQQWQRQRVFNAEDKLHQVSIAPRKGIRTEDDIDHNPLAIEYHTRDPSALVNSQDISVADTKLHGHTVEPALFTESERYHSSNFDLTKLVRQMQEPPPHGVEMRDRRWFTRIHSRCFRGDEMTNWLLSAFKDLRTREDAVEIGNVLMERGLFTHVRHKHAFLDGNYFYQIAPAHRSTDHTNAIASVFNRNAGRSIPPTPSTEVRMSPQVRPSRGDSDSSGPDSSLLAPMEKKHVLLSQVLRYNVDPGNRSEQEEVINVHYDRIHNPENCYHIYIDWTLTTPMLIRDALTKWSTLVEPYGLRLTRIPRLEACAHSLRHPFQQPRYIKLAIEPPERIPATPHFGSFYAPARMEDRQFYHKAVLRTIGFVLDFESTDSYSNNVDVMVTWGTMSFSMTQFVHRSGLMLAQISNTREWDFLFLPNVLAADRVPLAGRSHSTESIDSILDDIETLTRDADTLRTIYDEAVKPRLIAPTPLTKAMLASADIDVPPIQLPPLVLSRGS